MSIGIPKSRAKWLSVPTGSTLALLCGYDLSRNRANRSVAAPAAMRRSPLAQGAGNVANAVSARSDNLASIPGVLKAASTMLQVLAGN